MPRGKSRGSERARFADCLPAALTAPEPISIVGGEEARGVQTSFSERQGTENERARSVVRGSTERASRPPAPPPHNLIVINTDERSVSRAPFNRVGERYTMRMSLDLALIGKARLRARIPLGEIK